MLSVIDAKPSPTNVQQATWCLTLLIELMRLATFITVNSNSGPLDGWNSWEVAVNALRLILIIGTILLYFLFTVVLTNQKPEASSESERAPLLSNGSHSNGSASRGQNGTAANGRPKPRTSLEDDDQPGWVRPDKTPSRGWFEYLRGYSVFFPYLWPAKDRKLKIVVLVCVLLVVAQRAVNVLVPYQIGVITNQLSDESGPRIMPWGGIILYVLFRLLQGSNSLIGVARSTLWIPVNQYSYRELSIASFEHVHTLSLDFHLGKKTGEVLSALGKGNSINNFLDQITFQVLPMIVDLVVAIGYFLIAFDAYYALVVTIVTFWYIYVTIRLAKWRADARREMTNADRHQAAVKNDSMVSYETVKYFNAEPYEFDRYRGAVMEYQKAEYLVQISLQLMNLSQNLLFMGGVMIVCFIAAYQVTQDQMKVGKFFTLITYMAQLQAPLNFFGTFYRVIQNSMISSERLLELFKEQPTVVDRPGVKELVSCEGDIRFRNVKFAYDQRKNALQGLDFHCEPGTTTAFVGESGGGKSTVFRLLFRFYNILSGSIQVDGQDVRDLTIDSVRRHIGVVPQDTVLFNETLIYNLRYAKPDATDQEVYDACRAASIHDKILSFPDGYQTKVGERGLRLSGGEKQRVAIARTILKGPRIIMLDEATAALDTETEQHIQDALETLGKGRTMLVIAHRLSTIMRADQILVLHEGRVVERGTHEVLRAKKGKYENMWLKQVEAQIAAKEARLLKNKAERLRRESKGDSSLQRMDQESPSGSDEESTRRRAIGREQHLRDEDRKSDDEHGGHP
jgi:ABC-type transport system involved in Fe-S cluster assembly fused permease/ATPase subunit